MRFKDWLDELRHDFVFATRQMGKAPTWTLIVVSILAVGIAANAVVFSVVNAVILRPLPYPEPGRLVRVWETTPQGDRFSVSAPNFIDWRQMNRSFTDMAAISFPFPMLTLLDGGEPESLGGLPCTDSMFSVLGVPPLLGRTFSAEETRFGNEARVLVLSYGLWQRRFASDPAVIGRILNLSGEDWTVIGVMPEGYEFLGDQDVAIPFAPDPNFVRGDRRIETFARLKPGVSLEQAYADMSAVAKILGEEYPDANKGYGITMLTFPEWIIGPRVRQIALVLQIAVALMLLLACANVSNLLIARATTRQKELGLRAALGAGQSRIVRQLLTESVFLALLGTAAGLVLAYWAIPILRSLSPDALPRLDETTIDTNVVIFTVAISLFAGVLSGIAPALQMSRRDLFLTLREGHHIRTGGARRVRDALVVFELALALMLLIGAGLLVASFRQLNTIDPGFDPENVLAVSLTLPESQYPEISPEAAQFYQQVLENIETAPGVDSAGITMVNPFRGPRPANQVAPEGTIDDSEFVPVQWRSVTGGFFRALRIPLLQGRSFDERDRAGATGTQMTEAACIVSARLAERLWPNEDPIGKRLHWNRPQGLIAEVVGVVGDIRDTRLEAEPPPMFYFFHGQIPWPHMTFVVKTEGDPSTVSAAVRQAIWDVDKNLPAPAVGSLEQNISGAVADSRLNTQLLSFFAAIALLVATMGIYGIISYSVERRSHEIGVRMAMGAAPRHTVRLILRHAVLLIASGTVLGALGAFGFTRFLQSLLYETSPTHGATFVTLVLVLAVVCFVASYFPASRAAKVDPVITLRTE
jgi:predicted permease